MRFLKAALVTGLTLSLASPALAAGLALNAGGRTIAGPGIVTVAKTTSSTVMSNFFGNDACVTVLNMGATDFSLETTGGGVTAVVVLGHQSAALCQAAMTSFAINCNGTQSGACHAMWRVDR